MRSRKPALLAAFVLALLALAPPAHADATLLHWRFLRSTQLDSTLISLNQTVFDTSAAILTDNFSPISVAAIDSGTTSTLTGVTHAPRNLWVVVEVTGALQSADSIYVGTQFSMGGTPASNGSSGDQNLSSNWRWYNAQLLTAGGVVANNTGTQTFVFPIPCVPSGPNAWVQARYIRVILQGDSGASAVALATRAWLVNR
jgi:hypothetical protein